MSGLPSDRGCPGREGAEGLRGSLGQCGPHGGGDRDQEDGHCPPAHDDRGDRPDQYRPEHQCGTANCAARITGSRYGTTESRLFRVGAGPARAVGRSFVGRTTSENGLWPRATGRVSSLPVGTAESPNRQVRSDPVMGVTTLTSRKRLHMLWSQYPPPTRGSIQRLPRPARPTRPPAPPGRPPEVPWAQRLRHPGPGIRHRPASHRDPLADPARLWAKFAALFSSRSESSWTSWSCTTPSSSQAPRSPSSRSKASQRAPALCSRVQGRPHGRIVTVARFRSPLPEAGTS